MQDGVAVKAMSNYVQVAVGEHVYLCTLRGRFRKKQHGIMTGDHVRIQITGEDTGVVEEILPRRNVLVRPAIANVDQVFVVLAATRPTLNRNLLDRMLVILEEKELEAVICINKYDLLADVDPDEQRRIQELVQTYRQIGYPVIPTSIHDPESIALIKDACQNKISVLAGPSGVGKSSILNAIRPTLGLATGSVSSKSGQGRHTTRHVELLRIGENGFMADSPGFSVLDFPDMEPRELAFFFPEMVPLISGCRFASCVHYREPDCAVKEAVGKKQGVNLDRYHNYVSFLEEIMNRERRY